MRLSIITINLNKRDGLERTLASVRVQTFRGFEQIVVDGGSSDGSLDVIRAHAPTIARWVSEPDAEIRCLRRAEDWIENAKRKPLWYNLALVCKWRWDRFLGKYPPRHGAGSGAPIREGRS